MNKSFNKLYKIVFLCVFLTFVLICTIELAFRLSGYSPLRYNPGWIKEFKSMTQLCDKPKLIYSWKPGINKQFLVVRNGLDQRPKIQYRISNQMTRSPEVKVPKPTGFLRIIVLGDSIPFGFDVDNDKTFISFTERQLLAKPIAAYQQVEIINAGVLGYNPNQAIAWLKEYGLSLQPDIVILVLSPNDLDNPIDHFGTNAILEIEEYIPVDAVPNLKKHTETLQKIKRQRAAVNSKHQQSMPLSTRFKLVLAENSATVEAIRMLIRKHKNASRKISVDNPELQYIKCLNYMKESDRPELKWLEKQLQDLFETSEKTTFKTGIMYLPLKHQLADQELLSYNKNVLDIIQRLNIPYIDCSKELSTEEPDDIFLEDDCHLSETGHKKVSEALKQLIIKILTSSK